MDPRAFRDRYGFFFWLKWIFWFAGSFILAAVVWTVLMRRLFGVIEGPELTMTWVVSVFGSWFILVTPFMRKKEQIWKRLNEDQEKAVDAWLLGMGIFIGLLVASLFTWSWLLKERINQGGYDTLWIKSVFVSWLVILLPFLILMYRKADLIFKTAVERQTYNPKFRTVSVERSERLLPDSIVQKIKVFPPTLRQESTGHVVTLILRGGREVPNVFVLNHREILGIYDQTTFDFSVQDVSGVEASNPSKLPPYDESRWLKFDDPK